MSKNFLERISNFFFIAVYSGAGLCEYPHFDSACSTAGPTLPGVDFQVPKPMIGIGALVFKIMLFLSEFIGILVALINMFTTALSQIFLNSLQPTAPVIFRIKCCHVDPFHLGMAKRKLNIATHESTPVPTANMRTTGFLAPFRCAHAASTPQAYQLYRQR